MAAGRVLLPCMPALDSNGNPVSGALLNFYENNTTTRRSVYTTADLNVPLTNPVVADAAGVFPSIFADDEELYSVTCFSPLGVMLPKASYSSVRATTAIGDGLVVVSSFMQTVLDDATALAAKVTLAIQPSVLDYIPVNLHAGIRDRTNTTPLDAYIATALAAGVGYFPAGRYVFAAGVTVAVADRLAVHGDGPSATELVWTNNTNGLSLAYSSPKYPPRVTDLALKNRGLNVGTALEIAGQYQASFNQLGPLVRNVKVVSDLTNEFTGGWLKGIRLSRLWYPIVEACSITGFNDGSHTFGMDTAIELDRVQAPTCLNNTIFYAINGIKQIGNETPNAFGEGVNISGGEIVAVRNGIILAHNSVAGGISIHDIHINASYRGITTTNHLQLSIHDCDIFKLAPASEDWIGISVDLGSKTTIHHITFVGVPVDTTSLDVGIQVTNSYGVSIDHIAIEYFGTDMYGVLAGGGAIGTIVENVIGGEYPGLPFTPIVIAASTGGRFNNNQPMAIQNLGTGATPTVDNAFRPDWSTINPGATTITNLLGGNEGQVVELYITEAFTSIAHNGTINLQGGAAWTTPGAGAVLTLRKRNGVWIERDRRTP